MIVPEIRERLWGYMGGIARENKLRCLSAGGTANHVHILISLSGTITIAKAMQLIKGGSSKWVSETFPLCEDFEWQEGYGAFAVCTSALAKAQAYIARQEEHHKTRTFEEEYLLFLQRHGVQYDPKYVFD